jgi:hypothetical protein
LVRLRVEDSRTILSSNVAGPAGTAHGYTPRHL